ncbi:MAG: FHA domain-containing protein [Wenzhouxiangellaceae bacterium]|nr:FHA domain-containing protein [Wenzhouxiangellaceae bacterium]
MKYRLKAASGALTGQTFELGDETTVGSADAADIRIDGLAPEHARLVARDGGLVVEAGGETRLNGEPVARRALESGDELQFGPIRFVLQAPGLKPARVLDGVPGQHPASRRRWLIAMLAAAAAAAAWAWWAFAPGAA